jgi:hypothetical protein
MKSCAKLKRKRSTIPKEEGNRHHAADKIKAKIGQRRWTADGRPEGGAKEGILNLCTRNGHAGGDGAKGGIVIGAHACIISTLQRRVQRARTSKG